MEQFDQIIRLIFQNILLVGLASIFLLYFLAGKKEELSRNAVLNSSATICVFAFNMFLIMKYHMALNGWLQEQYNAIGIPTLPKGTWDAYPLILTSLLGLLAKDFADYWNHRLMHTKWGWPTHAAHHSDTHVNALTTYRVHFLEMFVMSASYILLLTWLQMPQAIPFVALCAALHNMYVHLDVDWRHGPVKYLVASPYFHRWHHADTPEAYGKNLANIVPLWDVMFGTYHDPGKIEAPMGLRESGVNDTNPVAILFFPFMEWGRMLRRKWQHKGTAPRSTGEPQVHPGE
ncbi:MAG: sterol desaturase family protein [Silicimonas sp.]|nr:sterol desaturase family protein [Silicimonas sp.]